MEPKIERQGYRHDDEAVLILGGYEDEKRAVAEQQVLLLHSQQAPAANLAARMTLDDIEDVLVVV